MMDQQGANTMTVNEQPTAKASNPSIFSTAEDRIRAATRLLESIGSSLSEMLTPSRAHALIRLKGLEVDELAQKALVSPAALNNWLRGSAPIMPVRQLDRIQLVLGFEAGNLSRDRVHVFHLDEERLGKDACAKCLDELMPLFRRSVMSIACDEQGKSQWFRNSQAHVICLSNGGHAVVISPTRSRLGAPTIVALEKAVHWAAHGSLGHGRSDLIVSAEVASRLSQSLPKDGDALAKSLAEQFQAVAHTKAGGGLKSLQPTL